MPSFIPDRHQPVLRNAGKGNVLQDIFFQHRKFWLREPVIDTWDRLPEVREALHHVNQLYLTWSKTPPGPFDPHTDSLWLSTADIMRDAGLPWHNNNLNLPEDEDRSWPFHFKSFERYAILAKASRVGEDDPVGYITNWMESNHYGIRAIQQELRHQMPHQKPILVSCKMESEVVTSAAQIFGLELFVLTAGWETAIESLTRLQENGVRPLIIAATLANSAGQADDFQVIKTLCKTLPAFLHVDGSRNFDYLTTLPVAQRRRLGLPLLRLQHPFEESLAGDDARAGEMTIDAATIVAGGTNCVSPPITAVLKARGLGSDVGVVVEYVRGTDSTLAGSRDAIGPLLTCLQELSFSKSGLGKIFDQCARNRLSLCELLVNAGIRVNKPPYSLDLVLPEQHIDRDVADKWGLKPLGPSSYLLTVQPSVSKSSALGLVRDLTGTEGDPTALRWIDVTTNSSRTILPSELTPAVEAKVRHFRRVGPSSGGYPLNQAPYSALGPLVGQFLPVSIPPSWAADRSEEILQARKASFGLRPDEYDSFPGRFTTGSTMGNRIGLHAALAQHPRAFVYFSSHTHYSVKKTVRDCDVLTGIWTEDSKPRSQEVRADALGRMVVKDLVDKALKDQAYCVTRGEQYKVILLCNIGTTFVGGRDDILAIRNGLRDAGIKVSHIHVDGALDLGFQPNLVALGPPTMSSREGRPVVQGITLSHHKAYGIMVSGEVLCYSPCETSLSAATAVDPRIIFETWLFQRFYSSDNLVSTWQYCVGVSNRLRESLAASRLAIRYNDDSIITLLERIPPWLIERFHLAPEGEWVHFVSMPHISAEAVDVFTAAISQVQDIFDDMFAVIQNRLTLRLGEDVCLKRVRFHDQPLCKGIAALAASWCKGQAPSFDFDTFTRLYVYSTMSFAALSRRTGRPLVGFLAAADADWTVHLGPLLVDDSLRMGCCELAAFDRLRREAYNFLASEIGLTVKAPPFLTTLEDSLSDWRSLELDGLVEYGCDGMRCTHQLIKSQV